MNYVQKKQIHMKSPNTQLKRKSKERERNGERI